MHLLFALVVLLAVHEVRGSPTLSLEKLGDEHEVPSTLADLGRRSLRKGMEGIDLEKRRSRLIKLGEKIRQPTGEEEEKLAKLREEISLIAKGTNENHTHNIIAINKRAGLLPYLYQGDILLTEEQLADLERESTDGLIREKRQTMKEGMWPEGKIYYYFDSSLNNKKRQGFMAGTKYLESRTCLKFINSRNGPSSIKIISGGGCYATAGISDPKYQKLSLADGCEQLGTVVHETMHALGIYHEQSRHDRDKYVNIDLKYVNKSDQFNYDKYSEEVTTSFTPYEYGSVMHYRADGFMFKEAIKKGFLAMTPKDRSYLHTMGGSIISFYDIQKINRYYGCDAKCSGGNVARCQNGGIPNPAKCSTCNCPSGYSGALCNERPTGCGETLEATGEWKTKDVAFAKTANIQGDNFKMCNYWVKAPAGKKIQVKLTHMEDWACDYGCYMYGMEIKAKADQKITNPRICCAKFQNQIFKSEVNPTPIITYHTAYESAMSFAYRYDDGTTGIRVTTPAPVNKECKNTAEDSYCESVASDFCKATSSTIDEVKLHCAKTCKLCGVAKKPCKDVRNDCQDFKNNGFCTSLDKYEAEYHCARTCGFCQRPA